MESYLDMEIFVLDYVFMIILVSCNDCYCIIIVINFIFFSFLKDVLNFLVKC